MRSENMLKTRLSFCQIVTILAPSQIIAVAEYDAKIVTIWQNDKRVLGIFSLRIRTNGYLGASGTRFTKKIVSATYELLMISGTYDELRQRQRCL